MNNELIEEKAQLYALGILNEDEVEDFESQIREDRELRDLVFEYQRLSELDFEGEQQDPPFHVFSQIMEKVDPVTSKPEKKPKVVRFVSWGGWAVAACTVAVFGLGLLDWKKEPAGNSDIVLSHLSNPRIVAVNTPSDEFEVEDRMLELAGLAEAYWFSREGIPDGQLLESEDTEVAELSGGFTIFDRRFNIGFIAVENLPRETDARSYHVWARAGEGATPVRAGTLPIGDESRGLFFFDLSHLPNNATVDSVSFFVTEEVSPTPPSPSSVVVLSEF